MGDPTTAFIQQYTNNVTMLEQQLHSNLRGAVDVEMVGAEFTYFEQLAATAMNELTDRNADTRITKQDHRRRRVALQDFDIADLIDKPDLIRSLIDPTNPYVRNFAAAAGRQFDDTIITAFDATVPTGKTGSSSDTFDSTNYEIGVGTSNLTTAKLRTARRILEAAENPEDEGDNQWYVVCSAEQREGLLGDSEFQNSDFNSVRALVDGHVDNWLGFKFLKSERLPEVTATNVRSVFAWRKSGMKLAVGKEPKGFVDVRPDKNHSTQVRYWMNCGAVRMSQKSVVRILCDEDL